MAGGVGLAWALENLPFWCSLSRTPYISPHSKGRFFGLKVETAGRTLRAEARDKTRAALEASVCLNPGPEPQTPNIGALKYGFWAYYTIIIIRNPKKLHR